MILVDSSVWIDRLRGTRTRAFDALDTLVAERPMEVAITEQIQMELCAGAAPADVPAVEALTASLVLLGVDPPTDFHAAAAMFRATRANGRIARKLADCLIASVALRHDAEVWHRDADFEAIAAVTALRTFDLR